MREAKDVIPWTVTDISIRPYDGFWSMNPSIHFDGQTWRCVLRCSDYAMPNGVTIRSSKARPAGNQTHNAMVIFDPQTWKPSTIHTMSERDGLPRAQCANIGFEDMRLFRTERSGLQGIAASLHLRRDTRVPAGGTQNQPPEQVLVSFDDAYNIVEARPIRGDGWSGTPQKNWVPFDGSAEPRFLYSIDRGTMFDALGPVHDAAAVVKAATSRAAVTFAKSALAAPPPVELDVREREERARQAQQAVDRRTRIRGANVQLVRGRRVAADTLASRPSLSPSFVAATTTPMTRLGAKEPVRVFGANGSLPSRFPGLRGGTQLVHVGNDTWLGIGHEMQFVDNKKWYWHTFYLVDARGTLQAMSEPMKLAPNGIEFAAGLGIDNDRAIISFGVDDMECKLGETRLSAVLDILHPVKGIA